MRFGDGGCRLTGEGGGFAETAGGAGDDDGFAAQFVPMRTAGEQDDQVEQKQDAENGDSGKRSGRLLF